MHHEIARRMGLVFDGLDVDHINRDGFDNRRCNLRVGTHAANGQNRAKQSNNKSGHKGVCWDKRSGKWKTEIQYFGKRKHLGHFADIELAAFVYAEAAHKYHGEFARVE